jgi:ABC-type multidrug transport system ATPase subunit
LAASVGHRKKESWGLGRTYGITMSQAEMRETDEVVVCSKLTKRFRRLVAVDGLDLVVRRGDVFGFLGPNGAGKSTTLRMMVGLVRPCRGSVTLGGHNVWRDRRAALGNVGALVEEPSFYKYLSGRQNLRILGSSGGHCSNREVDAALDRVGLIGRARDKVKSYSHGMRQRLGIALATLAQPDLVLLDEPTNGLDPKGMKEVREMIASLAREHGMTVFLSSHLLHEVEQVCTRIAVIDKGRLIESGAVHELLGDGQSCEIRVDAPSRAAEALKDLGKAAVTETTEQGLVVSLNCAEPSEVNRFLVERGFAVSALIPRKRSLEELYMKLMEDADASSDQD